MTPPSDAAATPASARARDWQVYCLCAAWCGLCNQWRADFERLAATHPAHAFAWIDIEDEAEVVDDVDVETFPTLLVARGGEPLFFGPVLPQAAGVRRLLASLEHGEASRLSGDATALLDRLQRRG